MFKDIIQIEVDLPLSHPIFDKVVIMLTLNLLSLLSLLLSEGQGYSQKDTKPLGRARLTSKSYKIVRFYF